MPSIGGPKFDQGCNCNYPDVCPVRGVLALLRPRHPFSSLRSTAHQGALFPLSVFSKYISFDVHAPKTRQQRVRELGFLSFQLHQVTNSRPCWLPTHPCFVFLSKATYVCSRPQPATVLAFATNLAGTFFQVDRSSVKSRVGKHGSPLDQRDCEQ